MEDTALYYNLYIGLLGFSILMAVLIAPIPSKQINYKSFNKVTGFLFISIVLLMGTFPILEDSGDRYAYFIKYTDNFYNISEVLKDKLFSVYSRIFSLVIDYQLWFILTSLIYTFNHYYFSKKITANHFIIFLALITNFVFLAYGVNTLRAGLACSFLLLALCKIDNKKLFYLFLILAIGFHSSMLLPAVAILISKKFNATKYFYYFWILCIPLSFLFGSQIQLLFASLVDDERLFIYLTKEESHYNIGFRIDFIIYSLIPIVVGYYYIFKKNYKDKLYAIIYNSYVIGNAFWVLVIRADFSDRFAYLSWYLYMIVLLYPLLNMKLFDGQSRIIALILIINSIFTIYMLK